MMIDHNSSDRNRFIDGILIVVALGLMAASIYSVYSAWRTGLAQSRAETASRLMAIRTSPRSTETPGINAWVSWSLLNHAQFDGAEDKEPLGKLIVPRLGKQFPAEFKGLLNALRLPVPNDNGEIVLKSEQQIGGTQTSDRLEFRNVSYIENDQQLFVVTARRGESERQAWKTFCAQASDHLRAIHAHWSSKSDLPRFDPVTRIRSSRVARFYVLGEDETLISLPLGTTNGNSLYLSEGDEFRKNPMSPSFVSNNFFFNFQYKKPLLDQASFSGMYLDLGGLGLVASVTIPVIYNGQKSVLGADIAFDMDWDEFARNLSPNLISYVAHVRNSESENWNPWNEFLNDIGQDQTELKAELDSLAFRESLNPEPSERKSVYLTTTRSGADLMAIQVNRSTWLLLLVSANAVKLPWTTMLLTSLVFLSLIFRIEQSRRHAVSSQQAARSEMQEKQNLLDTMQVPLMVVDPNTDEIVFCNRAAESIGMSQGDYFGKDTVAQDPDALQHYRKTQTLSEAHRRAYGVPIRAKSNDEPEKIEYAIVRSVSVTAPIESLRAEEHHRLGILFLIDEEKDLQLLLRQKIAAVRQDEKRQLSSLMNHGVDSLARILKQRFSAPGNENNTDDVGRWLSQYLSQRIQLIAWTLENWGTNPTTTHKRIIERSTVETTIRQYNQILRIVADDRQLREQLHWNNGVVAATTKQQYSQIICQHVDWGNESCFSVPYDGVFGFFVGEVINNAVRYGIPGSEIKFRVDEDQLRNELTFLIENETDHMDTATIMSSKPFGGTRILTELARLSGWNGPEFRTTNGMFKVTWSISAIRRTPQGKGD